MDKYVKYWATHLVGTLSTLFSPKVGIVWLAPRHCAVVLYNFIPFQKFNPHGGRLSNQMEGPEMVVIKGFCTIIIVSGPFGGFPTSG
jgi:hypothetical protein